MVGGTSLTTQENVSVVDAPLSSVPVTTTEYVPGVAFLATVPVIIPADKMVRPAGRPVAEKVRGSPLGSVKAAAALTAVIVSPSLLVWLVVLVPTVGAWFLESIVKVCVAELPALFLAVTTML